MIVVVTIASAGVLSWFLLPLENSIFVFRGSRAIEVLLRRDRSGASEVAFLVVAGFGFSKPKPNLIPSCLDRLYTIGFRV